MNSVEDLDVFKLAHQLALKTYSTTKTLSTITCHEQRVSPLSLILLPLSSLRAKPGHGSLSSFPLQLYPK